MTELDQVWSKMLGDAASEAGQSGRRGVADYLRLRATNDAIRAAGVQWLFDAMIEIAGVEMGKRVGISIEREEPYNFARGSSNMVGSLLEVRQGVRCLTVEAGWARVPADGIMYAGALAYARIRHFGIPRAGRELRLVHADILPSWLGEDDAVIDSHELRRHVELLLGV